MLDTEIKEKSDDKPEKTKDELIMEEMLAKQPQCETTTDEDGNVHMRIFIPGENSTVNMMLTNGKVNGKMTIEKDGKKTEMKFKNGKKA